MKINRKLSFQFVSVPSDKATDREIPVDILRNSEFCFSELKKCTNKAFNENKFLGTLKLSDIVLVFKKLDPTDKTKCLKKLCMINLMNL